MQLTNLNRCGAMLNFEIGFGNIESITLESKIPRVAPQWAHRIEVLRRLHFLIPRARQMV
jgi:hypothetical protein